MFEVLFQSLLSFLSFCGLVQSRKFEDPLSKDVEMEMLIRLNQKDEKAREILILHNLRLVAHIVKKYDIRKIDREDLISIGTIGLIKAIDSYKLESGHKLTTYAAKCIENEILMALRGNMKHMNTLSLDETIPSETESMMSLSDVVKDEEINIIDNFMMKEDIEKMKNCFHVLDDRETDVLQKRFGLNNQSIMTQKQIARHYHISRSYVSRIEKRAILKLTKEFTSLSKKGI